MKAGKKLFHLKN